VWQPRAALWNLRQRATECLHKTLVPTLVLTEIGVTEDVDVRQEEHWEEPAFVVKR
jgi:hypothetical protein